MPSSGILRRVTLVRTTRRNIPEDSIPYSRRCENLKSYKEEMKLLYLYDYRIIGFQASFLSIY
jgi:hypothetical protein